MIRPMHDQEKVAVDDLVHRGFANLRSVYQPSGTPPPLPGPVHTLVFAEAGRLCGTVSYYLDPPYVRLFRLAVDPQQRRAGVARALIDHLETHQARSRELELALYTIVETGNVAIFEKLGFLVRRQVIASYATGPKGQPVHEAEMVRGPSPAAPSGEL